jgi:hypothetical protein
MSQRQTVPARQSVLLLFQTRPLPSLDYRPSTPASPTVK